MRATRFALVFVVPFLFMLGCEGASGDWYGESGANDPQSTSEPYYVGADAIASSDVGAPDPDEPDEAPATNPFVMAAHDPQSTFAADVDTASYQIFVGRVGLGMLPDPTTVRVEEFVNFFSYDYEAPDPEGEVPFAISLAAAASPFRAGTSLLRVGIQGRQPPAEEKKPANLVFLVDVSGSMSAANKLPLVQHVLEQTLELLDPSDTISIVTYASSTGVRLGPTAVEQKSTILAAIQGLSAGGSTAGASGIELAYEQAQAAFIDGGLNHVLLCTDGDFNVGTSSTSGLVDLIEDKRRTGITLTVLGFGYDNLNDGMIESITNAGNGTYAFLGNEDMATDFVWERLLSTMCYIAQDMKIQVEFNAELVVAYRLLGYENRAIADEDFTDDTVDAGEIGAGHTVTALYEIVLAGEEPPQPAGAPEPEDGTPFDGELDVAADELCVVKVRYKNVGATESTPALQVDAALREADLAGLMESADADLQWAASVAALAEILKGSPFADEAHLSAIAELIGSNCAGDPDREELNALLPTVRSLLGL